MFNSKKCRAAVLSLALAAKNAMFTLASDLPSSVDDERFKSMDVQGAPRLILGTVFWIMRLVGILVVMSGIYKLLVARKDGEAEEINVAMMKIIMGLCFICFPWILTALHIVTKQ